MTPRHSDQNLILRSPSRRSSFQHPDDETSSYRREPIQPGPALTSPNPKSLAGEGPNIGNLQEGFYEGLPATQTPQEGPAKFLDSSNFWAPILKGGSASVTVGCGRLTSTLSPRGCQELIPSKRLVTHSPKHQLSVPAMITIPCKLALAGQQNLPGVFGQDRAQMDKILKAEVPRQRPEYFVERLPTGLIKRNYN